MSDPSKETDDFATRFSGWHYSLGWGDGEDSVAPFVPTPLNVVRKMLELAKAGAGDILYDLGCGDGRILFTALEEFNVKSVVGVEINPNMVKTIKTKAEDKGLKDQIKIINKNFFDVDLSPATIITLYLTTSGNAKLKPKFKKELQKGVIIVSHDFPINDWTTIDNDNGKYSVGSHKIYIYRIPESYEKSKKVQKNQKANRRLNRIKNLFERLDRD
jgi:SAM-dependent methyltransferase